MPSFPTSNYLTKPFERWVFEKVGDLLRRVSTRRSSFGKYSDRKEA